MFLLIFLVLESTIFGYPAWRILSAAEWSASTTTAVTAAVVIAALLTPAYVVAIRAAPWPRAAREAFAWITYLLLAVAGGALWHFVLALFVYFMAFNLLEALLPSLVGRAAPAGTRGTAMGVYSTSQFLGVFIGGQLGGALYQWVGAEAVFLGCALIAVVWLAYLWRMRELPKLDNRVIHLAGHQDWGDTAARLRSVPGVLEAVVVAEFSTQTLERRAG